MMATADLTFEKGLPASVDTERLVLGSILLNDAVYIQVAGSLEPEDFSLEKHRRILRPHAAICTTAASASTASRSPKN